MHHFGAPKRFIFEHQKSFLGLENKIFFEPRKSIFSSISSQKLNFGPEKKFDFLAGAGKEIEISASKSSKIGQKEAKNSQKQAILAHFEAFLAHFGLFSSKSATFCRTRHRNRNRSSKPARKCWLASLACAFSRD